MKGLEIVVIEDNDDDAKQLMHFFQKHFDNNIRLIQDGAEAVEFILLDNDNAPKLILLDLTLPTVDGIELFRIIRSEPPEKNISIILLVASSTSKDYIESIGLHPDGYLKKSRGTLPPMRI